MNPTATVNTVRLPTKPAPGAVAPGHRPPTGRGVIRRYVIAAAVAIVVVAGIATLSIEGARSHAPSIPPTPGAAARTAASVFLDRYLATNGRVVRHDQGGDTVSEGQAYAMLLAVALGNKAKFQLAWEWERRHLETSVGLFAYRWDRGSVTGAQPAADADLETAWALVLGARRFGVAVYHTDAVRISSAILAHETVTTGGRIELVAGPWAQRAPFVVDPSYLAPEAMAALAAATGDPRWSALEVDSTALLGGLVEGVTTQLPPDWAEIGPQAVAPTGAPSTAAAPAYGLDAQRVPVLYGSSCVTGERAVAAADWPILRQAASGAASISYSLAGARLAKAVSPLGLVAAAGAADAAGQRGEGNRLLDRASAEARSIPTYYGDAWVALGRVLLDTHLLSSCPPGLAH